MKQLTCLTLALILGASSARSQDCPTFIPRDAIIGDINGVANYLSQDDLEALSVGTVPCNLSSEFELAWNINTNQHPHVGQALYRYKDMGGWFAFEQVGMSWLRPGILALSATLCCSNCTPTNGQTLGKLCSNPQSPNLNGSQALLVPRSDINPDIGFFTLPTSNPPFSGSTARRLQVEIADVEDTSSTTTRYFAEAHIITPDESTGSNGPRTNNESYREVLTSGSGSSWNFLLTGTTVREVPALGAWKAIDPAVVEVPGTSGKSLLSYKVTDLGAGQWHYEYAIYNRNDNFAFGAFEVQVPAGVNVSNIDFHGVTYRDGDGVGSVSYDDTPWSVTQAGTSIRWDTESFASDPNANALRWGTTYNFRFDADAPPADGTVRLDQFAVDASQYHTASVPSGGPLAPSFCDGNDGSHAFCPCGGGAPDAGCEIAQGTGGVRAELAFQDPTAMTATVRATGYPAMGAPSVILIRGNSQEAVPVPFMDGVRCVGLVGFVRLAATNAFGGQSIHELSHGAGPGAFHYQAWFRNTPASYCVTTGPSGGAGNLSNGLLITW